MKRLCMTMMMAAIVATSVFAKNVNNSDNVKWDGSINKTKLSEYLKLDYEQREQVSEICDYFKEEMKWANKAKKNEEVKLRKAIYGNLKLMKQTLDDKQYRDYLTVMAVTLNNKGIVIDKAK